MGETFRLHDDVSFFFRGNRASTILFKVASDDMMSLAFIAVLLSLLYRLLRARAQRVVSS